MATNFAQQTESEPIAKLTEMLTLQKEELERLRAQLYERDAYIGHLSHQLRTPLMAIIGYGGLLTGNNTEHRQGQASLLCAAEAMLSVLDDIPLAAHAPHHLQLRPYNTAIIMSDLKGFFAFYAERKNLSYTLQWDENIPASLLCDLPCIRQVMMILVQNAIKFTQHGGVTVNVSLQSSSSTHASLLWVVEDSGIGIAPNALKHLFSQSSDAQQIRRPFGRAGKNLRHAEKLVASMGGTLHVHSVANEGSRFHFLLDLPICAAIASTQPTTDYTAHSQWPTATVLIVDDHAMNRHVLAAMLNRFGITTVDTAENGEEATAKVVQNNYDLILMDCQMPQMDGFEATRIIKQSPHHGHIPIIGITADILRADNAKCFAAGMDDYFHKPLAIHTLEQLLHKWLASKTVQGAAAP